MALTTAALLTELQTDPTTIGYASAVAANADATLAGMLNLPRAGISIFRGVIPTWELLAATDATELSLLVTAKQQLYQYMVSAGTLDISDSSIRALLASMFAAGSVTRTAFLARISRQGSRAEQLGGAGTTVTQADISRALRGAS